MWVRRAGLLAIALSLAPPALGMSDIRPAEPDRWRELAARLDEPLGSLLHSLDAVGPALTQFGGGVFQVPQGPAQAAAQATAVGTWAYQDANVKVLLVLAPNGRYMYSVERGGQAERQMGDYRIAPDGIDLKADGATLTGIMRYRMVDADNMEVSTPDGLTIPLRRQAGAAQTPEIEGVQKSLRALAGLSLPAGRVLQPDLKTPLPLPPANGGHIVFSRAIQVPSPIRELPEPINLTKMYVVNGDGTGLRPFLAPDGLLSFREPNWSPRYDRLAFTSDYRNFASACYEDIFVANADGSGVFRITGNEIREPGKNGWAKISGACYTRMVSQATATSDFDPEVPIESIRVSAQGCDRFYTPTGRGATAPKDGAARGHRSLPGVRFASLQLAQDGLPTKEKGTEFYFIEIPRAAVGDIWLKVWTGKNSGALYFIRTQKDTENFVQQILPLNSGSFACWKPSLSNDRALMVGMATVSWTQMRRNPPAVLGHEAPLQVEGKYVEGSDDIAVFSGENGMPLALFQTTKAQGEGAKDPAVSPDGQWIAAAWGRTGSENLALIPMADLLANRSLQPRVIVPGRRDVGTGVQMFGAAAPAWSADGRQIAFVMGTGVSDGSVASNLCVVGADGANPRQLTALDITHGKVCTDPCFSPDGSRIAFTVISSRFGVMKLEQLALLRDLTADIYTIRTDGTDLRRLTNDGVSFDPAWGP